MGSRVRSVILRSLGYPTADKFSVEDVGSFRQLVVWLEDTKIRFYKPEDRAQLRATGAHAAWEAAFASYLHEQGCEIEGTKDQRGQVIDWLLQQAVGFEYKDNAGKLNTMAAALSPAAGRQSQNVGQGVGKVAPHGTATKSNMQDLTQLESPEVCDALMALASLLNVPVPTAAASPASSRAALLKAVLAAAQRKVAPGAIEASRSIEGHAAGTRKGAMVFGMPAESFPLGFSLGDTELDAIATLLRVLHVNDLRQLQTQVDRYIVEMQEYTANPKTDARLGRVGT